MPAVFVHGVPDTYRVWTPLLQYIERQDVITLALPGFDGPIPGGFTATKEEYVDWLIAQLELQPGPIDLVGHDWGCILAARVASIRPDLIRTWAGGDGPVSRDYVWHPLAKIWQTPGAGEEFMARLDPEQFSGQLEQLGVPPELAVEASKRLARETGAKRIVTFDTGHWFQLQAPAETAKALEEHWHSAAS